MAAVSSLTPSTTSRRSVWPKSSSSSCQEVPQKALRISDEGTQKEPVTVIWYVVERDRNDEASQCAFTVIKFEGEKTADRLQAGLEAHFEGLACENSPSMPGQCERPAVNLRAAEARHRLVGPVSDRPSGAAFLDEPIERKPSDGRGALGLTVDRRPCRRPRWARRMS